MKDQLRQASKLEAVGRLAGGIAHDFNNLLTVINGCAELLAEESARDGGKLSNLTEDIRRAGERAASLTGQLLTFSRKRDIQISAVDVNEVMRRHRSTPRPRARRAHPDRDFPGGGPPAGPR